MCSAAEIVEASGAFTTDDAPGGRRLHIDVVQAHPCPADHLERRCGGDHLCIYLGRRAHHEGNRITKGGDQLLPPGADDDLHVAPHIQPLDGSVGNRIGNNDLGTIHGEVGA